MKKIISLFQTHWIVSIIFLLACAVRIYSVSDNSVLFFYDQARDFTIVKDIALNHDLKVQGPSASGTNDTIYHGVLYYYILVPFFLLGQGNPQVVAYGLAILGSLSIFIVYILGLSVFKSKAVAALAALLLAVSFINTHQATWLSNPQILVLSFGLFYLSMWKIFFEKPTRFHFILGGGSLGLSIQAGIFEIFLIATLVALYVRKSFIEEKIWLFNIKQVLTFVISTLLVISSMIITQILMIQRNVLTFEKLQQVKRDIVPASKVIEDVVDLYIKIFQDSLVPTGLILLFLFFFIPLIIGWRRSQPKVREWLIFALTSPLWLLLVQYRNSPQILIGIELFIYLALAYGLIFIKKNVTFGTTVFYLFITVFAIVNLMTIREWKASRSHYYGIQKGTLLSEQLELIDKTYELAEGNNFTISSSTNPYGINVTWGYLYDWYGRKKYGYVPSYYGMSQTGYYGQGLLAETSEPATTHFTILEPDTGLASRIMNEFLADQDLRSSTPSAISNFGTLELQIRSQK